MAGWARFDLPQGQGRGKWMQLTILIFAWLWHCTLWSLSEGLTIPTSFSMDLEQPNASALTDRSSFLNATSLSLYQYVVYPRKAGDQEMKSTINTTIYRILRAEQIETVESPLTGIEFWIISATAREHQALSRIPHVSQVSRQNGYKVT